MPLPPPARLTRSEKIERGLGSLAFGAFTLISWAARVALATLLLIDSALPHSGGGSPLFETWRALGSLGPLGSVLQLGAGLLVLGLAILASGPWRFRIGADFQIHALRAAMGLAALEIWARESLGWSLTSLLVPDSATPAASAFVIFVGVSSLAWRLWDIFEGMPGKISERMASDAGAAAPRPPASAPPAPASAPSAPGRSLASIHLWGLALPLAAPLWIAMQSRPGSAERAHALAALDWGPAALALCAAGAFAAFGLGAPIWAPLAAWSVHAAISGYEAQRAAAGMPNPSYPTRGLHPLSWMFDD